MSIHSKQTENNNNLASAIRHSLGYLPAILLRAIIEDKIISKDDTSLPKSFSFHTCCLYMDISHFFNRDKIKEIKPEKSAFQKTPSLIKNNISQKKKNDKRPLEFYHFFINRYFEKLTSIITNHGGDIILQGTSMYAIWPPEQTQKIEKNKGKKNEEFLNLCLKSFQCAFELQKKVMFIDIGKECSFKPKIGISMGECKFYILKDDVEKYEYVILGNSLFNSCDNAKHDNFGGKIITDDTVINIIKDYLEYDNFIDNNKKYYVIKGTKIQFNQFNNNNKSTANVIKNNFSLDNILNKIEILKKFHPFIFSDIFHNSIINEKFFKEIRPLTLLYLRLKMKNEDLENPEKIQEIFQIIKKTVSNKGGSIHKVITDEKGLIVQVIFGTSQFFSNQNELMGVLASFDLSSKLKKIGIQPIIGITSDLSFYGLCGTMGGRKEISIIGNILILGLICVEKAENINEKNSIDYNILVDEKTMLMIDSKIPCKFWEKVSTKLGMELNLFTPVNVSNMIHKHNERNLFPLIGCHLHIKNNDYELDEKISKLDDIVYFEHDVLRKIVNELYEFTFNKSKTKVISVSSLTGCGKTLLLKRSLDLFFKENSSLKNILCFSSFGSNYPFVFNINLFFVMHSEIMLSNDKKYFRSIQNVLKDIFSTLYFEDQWKKYLISVIQKNKCEGYFPFFQYFFEISNLCEMLSILISDQKGNVRSSISTNSFFDENLLDDDIFIQRIHSFFIDLITEYRTLINNLYKDTSSEYKIEIPIFIVIENFNLCDDLTKNFIKYYLDQIENNPFLIITTNSISIYPNYNYLSKDIKDPFYNYENNEIIKKYNLDLYDNLSKINSFVHSILFELRNIDISYVSEKILKFLLYKTSGGIPLFILRLIIEIYDENLLIIDPRKKILLEGPEFEEMLEYNDFTDINIPIEIEKNIGEVIDAYLDIEEVYILKLASLLGNVFDLIKLKQVFLIENSNYTMNHTKKDSVGDMLYDKLKILESKNIIEILEDLDPRHKFVIYKFSIPLMREILYQRIPLEFRNRLHYIIGKMIKLNIYSKQHNKNKYISDSMELGMLEKHLKKSEITINADFLKNKNINETQNGNLNINNLKTLIVQRVSAKIGSIKVNDDKKNMIKAGYIFKKSDGKLTWENRYLVLTTNRVVYYYNEEDYKSNNKSPLGIFYLQNIFSVNLLTDGYIGGKKNIFSISVREWIKKGNFMAQRIYYLSIEDREELYKWVIAFNVLKIKAFYDNYRNNFGYIKFPLYDTTKNENITKIKKYEFKYIMKVETNNNNMDKRSSMLPTLRTNIITSKIPLRKMSIFSPYFNIGDVGKTLLSDVEYENYLIKVIFFYIKFVLKYSITIFLTNTQKGLSKKKDDFDNKNTIISDDDFDFHTPDIFKDNEVIPDSLLSLKGYLKLFRKKYEEEKNNVSLYSTSYNIEQTEKQKLYFQLFYKDKMKTYQNIIYKEDITPQEWKIISKKRKLFIKNKPIDIKNDLTNILNKSNDLSFQDTNEKIIDEDDYLKYTEYVKSKSALTSNDGSHGSPNVRHTSSNHSTAKYREILEKDSDYEQQQRVRSPSQKRQRQKSKKTILKQLIRSSEKLKPKNENNEKSKNNNVVNFANDTKKSNNKKSCFNLKKVESSKILKSNKFVRKKSRSTQNVSTKNNINNSSYFMNLNNNNNNNFNNNNFKDKLDSFNSSLLSSIISNNSKDNLVSSKNISLLKSMKVNDQLKSSTSLTATNSKEVDFDFAAIVKRCSKNIPFEQVQAAINKYEKIENNQSVTVNKGSIGEFTLHGNDNEKSDEISNGEKVFENSNMSSQLNLVNISSIENGDTNNHIINSTIISDIETNNFKKRLSQKYNNDLEFSVCMGKNNNSSIDNIKKSYKKINSCKNINSKNISCRRITNKINTCKNKQSLNLEEFVNKKVNSTKNIETDNIIKYQESLNDNKNLDEKEQTNNIDFIFNKIKEINTNLQKEKKYEDLIKNLKRNNANKINGFNNYIIKETPRKLNKKRNAPRVYSVESTSTSTNKTNARDYPDVYYINENNNLHNKIHISCLFSNLKKKK